MSALREVLAAACAAEACSAKALTVLSITNDPFRVDTPARQRDGEWLAMHCDRLGLLADDRRPIHLRGLHYLLVSTTGLTKPNGLPYRNIEEDWDWLCEDAAKAARWLGMVPFERIVDARNSAPVIRVREDPDVWPPRAWISVGLDVEVPDAVDLQPSVIVSSMPVRQPYRIVFYGEKTSLEEFLSPAAARCDGDLYLPAGEISDTMLHQMAATGAADGRPMVVLCFSDCDPSGWQMPISIARKLQALKTLLFPDLEFQVRRVALLPSQVKKHGLPSSPLKATERRADDWQAAMGVEQTEIDALAALQPDLLRRWVREAVAPFFDRTLYARVAEVESEWREACQEAVDEQTNQEHLDSLADQANAALDTVREQIAAIEAQIRIDPSAYDLPAWPELPEPRLADGPDGLPLIDSAWGWAEQSRRLVASKAYVNGEDRP